MRSRYAAFALGLGEYLVETLSAEHADRAVPRAALARELSRAKDRQRFMALRVLESHEQGSVGEVLFYARIFERGVDRSFAELSSFAREEGRWRYVDGVLVPGARLPKDLEGLGREAFLALARE
jgi:SEC-C motif-containing protein